MNQEQVEQLKEYLQRFSPEYVLQTCAEALFHLRCVSGSRNSFLPEVLDAMYGTGCTSFRQPEVERMHIEAADFISLKDFK